MLCLSPLFVVGGWFVVTTVLRKMARMTKDLGLETGSPIRCSGWGSASINGVGCQNIVKMQEHEEGYLVRTMWIFGGGKLWLPKNALRIGELKPSQFFIPQSRVIISELNQVILYGKLADFIQDAAGV